jgi:sugar phosphate isomerase/epimerase
LTLTGIRPTIARMLKLSAFADEISPDLDEQIRVCKECGVTHIELRGVNKINVLGFDNDLRAQVRAKVSDAGMGIAAIGSPIGKVKINEPWDAHFDRFKIAVELAEFFESPLIRIFSYYPPEKGQDMRAHRDEVMRRMRAKLDYIKGRKITLVHENEADIYGEKGRECLDLMKTLNSPQMRCAFDFANFVQAGERPLDNWPSLKPFTTHIHVKDAKMGTGTVVPGGEGDGQLAPIIKDAYASGYRGFLSLEPHLAAHEQFSGFSGPDLFKVAVDALRKVCGQIGVPLAH